MKEKRFNAKEVKMAKQNLLELLSIIQNLIIMDCLGELDLQVDSYGDQKPTVKYGYSINDSISISCDTKEAETKG